MEKIAQVKRKEETDFKNYIDEMLVLNLINKEDEEALNELFNKSSRHHINPCPGVSLEYCWPLDEAGNLDGNKNFSEEVKRKIIEAFDVLHQSFIPVPQKEL